MIKCKIKNPKAKVTAKGTTKDLVTDTAVLIRVVYSELYEGNKELAEQYKNTLIAVLLDPKSPVWKV